jgi:hypothetical protein
MKGPLVGRRLYVVAVLGALGAGAGFAACTGTRPSDHVPPPATTTPAPQAPSPAPTAAAADAAAVDASDLGAAVAAAKSCADPRAAILNLPDGGVVFNNAMTAADAGHIDRMQGVLDALGGQIPTFRCCFEGWLRDHPGDAKLLLRMTLAPDGSVVSTEFDDAQSTVSDPLTRACVQSVATDARYPASPTGNATTVEYPFVVAAEPR